MNYSCVDCNKRLSKNEVGISKKLLGDASENNKYFLCYECLSEEWDVSVEDLKEKVKQFKEEGCKLFQ